MNLTDVKDRIDDLVEHARRTNKYAFAVFLVSPGAPNFSLTLNGDTNIFKGQSSDPEALFAQAREAIDERDPVLLARTLGIEPAQSVAAE